MMSMLMTVMAVAPLVGPLAGGQILALASWRAIFWTLVGVGVGAATLAALASLPETLPRDRRNKEPLSTALRNYAQILGQRRILGFASTGAFLYGGIFANVAGAPFAYIDYYRVPPALFGLLFELAIFAIMAANLLNVRLIPRYGSARLLQIGALAAPVSGMVLAFDALSGAGGLAGLVTPLLIFNGSIGLIVANSIAGALAAFPERAGAVSALVGALQYGAGILGSGLVGALADGTPWPMSLVIALSGLGSALCAWTLVSARPGSPTDR
jgi:DHA1 family bicyclomycin/chloramphenicol resistance-like MFS transporter